MINDEIKHLKTMYLNILFTLQLWLIYIILEIKVDISMKQRNFQKYICINI